MICAVDPGISGAVAILSDGGHLVAVHDMPTVTVSGKQRVSAVGLADILAARKFAHCYVEQVGAMPGQGVTSMFSFGRSAGVIDGVCAALGIPVTMVTPGKWKRGMQVTADKGSSRARALQLWPGLSSSFARVRDDGRAEAALIGYYCAPRRELAAA